MMLVKITILLFVILAIWTLLTRAYYKANPIKGIALSYILDNDGKPPAWLVIYAILIFAEVAMILASVIWLLFGR